MHVIGRICGGREIRQTDARCVTRPSLSRRRKYMSTDTAYLVLSAGPARGYSARERQRGSYSSVRRDTLVAPVMRSGRRRKISFDGVCVTHVA